MRSAAGILAENPGGDLRADLIIVLVDKLASYRVLEKSDIQHSG
jgi:hypothetical protein